MAEKRRNEVETVKVQEAQDTMKIAAEQQQASEKERKGLKSPSPEQELEIEEGGMEPHTMSTYLNQQCPRE